MDFYNVVTVTVAGEPSMVPRPWLVTVGALAGLVSVVVSASRAAGVRLPLGQRIRVPLIALAGVGRLAAVALAVPLTRERLLGSSPLSSRTGADRVQMWSETLRLIGGDPVMGAGPSGFIDAIPRFHTTAWYEMVGSQTAPATTRERPETTRRRARSITVASPREHRPTMAPTLNRTTPHSCRTTRRFHGPPNGGSQSYPHLWESCRWRVRTVCRLERSQR